MTQHEEDQPFIRPGGGGRNVPTQPPVSTPSTTGAPLFLDPELHSTVLKPPRFAADSSGGTANVASPPSASRTRRRAGWAVGFVALVALVATVSLTVFQLSTQPTSMEEELNVEHMPTRPSVAWSAPGGSSCGTGGDEHHMILTDIDRLWSLDLRTGRTLWSAKIPTLPSQVICLPEAGLVAIINVENLGRVHNITFLDPDNGEVVDTLPGSSAVDVVPLGGSIGILGPGNVLSMVRPDALDAPLWTHTLPQFPTPSELPQPPGDPEDPNRIHAFPISDDAVHLISWREGVTDYPGEQVLSVISLSDGTAPPWAVGAADYSMFTAAPGGVMLRGGSNGGPPNLTALDQDGRELWNMPGGEPTIIGDRLFVVTRDGLAVNARLEHVDPLTGQIIGDASFAGDISNIVPMGTTHVAVVGQSSITLLDERLRPMGTEDLEGRVNSFITGTDQLLIEVVMDTSGERDDVRVMALDAEDLSLTWTLDLEPGQQVEQMGSHLVIADDSGTLQGLWSSS